MPARGPRALLQGCYSISGVVGPGDPQQGSPAPQNGTGHTKLPAHPAHANLQGSDGAALSFWPLMPSGALLRLLPSGCAVGEGWENTD